MENGGGNGGIRRERKGRGEREREEFALIIYIVSSPVGDHLLQ